ncbi:non-ribosomal peptide synthetase [Saccharomonospora halophila]|uniref:non-ribosomal peptide synthetase n=1 Tax=Saccharomonospora halophila TaxID=129922 RepID=UPI0003A77E74|nr:non-ribosomal peptide synthetase [Saccharomonospora halophila]
MVDTDALREDLVQARLAGRARDLRTSTEPVADRSGPVPLSFGQQGMWFLSQLRPDSPEYLVSCALEITGPLDSGALRAALQRVVERHEILRTRYELSDGEPVQVIDEAPVVRLPIVEVADATEPLRQDLGTPIHLGRQHPFRARLLRRGAHDHVLSLVLHHIACDAASCDLLVDELAQLYRSYTTRTSADPAPLPTQYADYAVRQRQRSSGEVLDRRLRYWREMLAGSVPLDLPTDRPRSAARDRSGEDVLFRVSADLTRALRAVATRCETTLFVVLLTAFQVLLARYSGKRDVVVGSAVSARTRADEQRMIGYLQNVLPLRANWTGDPVFTQLCGQGGERLLDALDNQEVPLRSLTGGGHRSPGQSDDPLFQVMFDLLEHVPTGSANLGVDWAPVDVNGKVARFDLTLQMAEQADGSLRSGLNYATALFDHDTAERMVGHFERLVTAIAGDPDRPLSTLEMLAPDERSRLLAGGDGGRAARIRTTVSDAVADHARRTPEAPAVVPVGATGVGLSYRELDEDANRIARYLTERGVGSESLVAVCLGRGRWLLPVLLGVWRAGAAYVPLDPAHPDDRLGSVVGDSGARTLITESALRARLDAVCGECAVVVVDDDAAIPRCSARALDHAPEPETLAYVIYTSGSTGRPKGVLVSHASLMNYLSWAADDYVRDTRESSAGAPVLSSVAFDLTVTPLYTPLLCGRPVYLPEPDLGPEELGTVLAGHAPFDFVKLTPGHLDLLTKQLTPDERAELADTVVAGGESFSTGLAAEWRHTRVVNEYGPTETTVGNAARTVDGTEESGILPLGRPIPGTSAYVLDETLAPMPVGVAGELYIGGGQLARGYLGQPALTAERFVPNPFGPAGARLYRTGDRCRVLATGEFEFLGRTDTQLNIRGYRVEPAEIEAVLKRYPGVEAAVVAVRDGVFAGYVVAADEYHLDIAELEKFLTGVVPAYMVPSVLVRLDAVPLTANGKIDQDALPVPGRAEFSTDTYTPPSGDVEERIARVWRSVLRLDEVGANDSFFDLGGDSLHAVAVVGALREDGLEVSMQEIFQRPTVAGLAEVVGERPEVSPEPSGVAPFAMVTPSDAERVGAGVRDAYPLSMVQAGMVYEMVADADAYPYLNTTTYGIRDGRPFSVEAMREAADVVVGRHEVLRTSFDFDTFSEPLQLVHDRARLRVKVHDLRGLDEREQQDRIGAHRAEERRTPFDLASPSLLRMCAHVHADDRWSLTITECHPILEGWSYHLLLMELLDCYAAIRDGRDPEFAPAPEVRYADFVAAERASLDSDADREYWTRVIEGTEKLELPRAWAGPPGPGYYRLEVPFRDLLEGLTAVSRAAEVPLKSVLHTAHLKVMSMLTPQREFFTGLVCDARPELPGAERVLGMFLNTVPFRFRFAGGTWRDLAREVFATETELWSHRRFPLPAMQRQFGDRRLLDVMFNFLDFREVDEDLVDVYGTVDDSPNEFPLSVTVFRLGLVDLTFRTRVIGREHGHALAEMYRLVLEAIAAGPDGDARVSPVPNTVGPLTGTEVVGKGIGGCRPVHELVAGHARTRPDGVAVRNGSEGMTYAQLDLAANRLARHLMELGVRPETPVGICLDGGPDLVVAILGVLKAGAAYVPLDPAHPADRVTFCLTDSGAAMVLTREGLLGSSPAVGTVPVVCLDAEWTAIGRRPDTCPSVAVEPESLAYVIYTSGSTGRPKGVMVTHGGLANYLTWAAEYYGPAADGGAPMVGSVAYDLSVTNLFLPLVLGREIDLLPDGSDMVSLAERLRGDGDFTVLKATPTHLELLRSELDGSGPVSSVSTVVIGGEELRQDTVEAWRALAPSARFVNEYGPTETVVGCSVHEVGPGTTGSVPIGTPIADTRLYVFDAFMRPVPAGVSGEIYIGGAGVARGYRDRPGLTAERFVPDPYGPPGARLYRSGDLGFVRADGELAFQGRLDEQVKIHGHRIEPGEIESRLREHPRIEDAVVVATPGPEGHSRLIAYVVGEAEDDLSAFLLVTLPTHMVPSAFVPLDALPVGPGGKVDRARLPEPPSVVDRRARDTVAPRTETERVLTEIWASVLGLERVGVQDDFVELGGDSVLTIHAVSAARKAGVPVSPRLMLRHGTVAGLAAALRDDIPTTNAEQGVVTGEVPLPPIHRALIAEGADLDEYTQTAHLLVDPAPVDPALLERALREIVTHHDVLRLRIRDGHAHLVAAEQHRLLEVSDLRGLPAAKQDRMLSRLAAELSPDIVTGPALRARLFRFDDADPARLVLAAHRSVVDGVSWPVLVSDLDTAYRHLEAGQAVALPSKTSSFREWARRLDRYGRGAEIERQIPYWLARGGQIRVPADRDGGANTPNSVRTVTMRASLDRPPADMRDILLAALALVVTGRTGDDRMVVELEGHGREELFADLDVSRTVGWFTTLYPVEIPVPVAREDVTAVSRAVNGVPDGGIGFGLLRHLDGNEQRERLRALPPPQIRFNYMGTSPGGETHARFRPAPGGVSPARPTTGRRSREFEIDAGVDGGELQIVWAYSENIHHRRTVRALAEHHLAEVRTMLAQRSG